MRPLTKAQLATLWNFVGEKPPKRGALKFDLSEFRVLLPGATQEQAAVISAMAAKGVREVFQFCLPSRTRGFDKAALGYAIRRFVSIAWLLHSEMMRGADGAVLTLTQLARLPQLKCSKVALSLSAKHFADRFKFHSRVQKRTGSKENYAAAAKTGWDKRRARIKARSKSRKKPRP